jgi:hypothetical protein
VRHLRGAAHGLTAATVADCVGLVSRLEGYPSWHPEVVREVSVLELDESGLAGQVEATLHLALGPLGNDFELLLALAQVGPETVVLERLPYQPSDDEQLRISWWFVRRDDQTEIGLEIDAHLDIPRLVPLPGLADSLTSGFVKALCQALEHR